MQLDILRHAKSDWGDERQSDHERSLSARGRRATVVMGRYLRARGAWPELVLCSSALRTRETWAGIADELGAGARDIELVIEEDLYLASAARWLQRLNAVSDAVSRILIVGHNPGVAELALQLAGSGDDGLLRRLGTKYPAAALATLSFEADAPNLAAGKGHLDSFLTPKDLA